MIDYNQKKFKPVTNTENGDTSSETIFEYFQNRNTLTSEYSGGKIIAGHLIGIVDELGNIDMRYHHINIEGEIMTGICKSMPEILPNGKIRLHEKWQWTSGDCSEGESILEEVN
ncbi:n-acetylglutamate synthase [Lacihabitans sp. LS3-19]|uniref:n-acetylglutamate synthase n=1 Tax=Lacihabitans sp. LS3-19 TaxID=2487335 RepID=UPI0020CC8F4C|nr:n-acetylglutamate synthase [Lacihabitans sp. LS3-19]MCP9766668.1 n-acetylglutamate synthase [Lacihabitans sp. LS3-19]